MKYTSRVPEELIKNGHYRGRPADSGDKIIHRRIQLTRQIEGFTGKNYELVEIGCGNGASIIFLSPDMKSCLGVDIEDSHQEEFNHLKNHYQADNCTFKLINIEKELPDKQFERLISFEVIEHLENESNIERFYGLLKPGGIAAITVPNKWWIFETHGAKLPLLHWNRVPFFSWLPRPIHERYANARIYTKRRIRKLLQKAGFQVISLKYVTAPLDVLKDSRLKRFLTKVLFNKETTGNPFLATSIFVVAVKNQ